MSGLTVPDNHPDYRTLRYGWRWYWIDPQGVLTSPVTGDPLPPDGVLEDVHMIPLAELMWHALRGYWLDFSPEDIRERGYALTFGRVYGPFSPDHNINCMFGSTRVARYAAKVICTDQAVDVPYSMSVIRSVDLPILQAVEKRIYA